MALSRTSHEKVVDLVGEREAVNCVSTEGIASTLTKLGRAEDISNIMITTMDSPPKNTEDTTFHRVIKSAQERAPSSGQVKNLLVWLIAGVVVLVLGGLAFVATATTLAVVVPLVILFSPVLVPLGIVLFLATAGTVSVVGSGLVAISAASWLYNYCKGRDPPGADRVDAARDRIVGTAREFKEWASNYSSQMRAAPSA